MNLRKKTYRLYVAFCLLLSFAATQLPFELFHSHNNIISCGEKNNKDGICTHKSHIGKQERFCFACSIQVEKTFDLPSNTFVNTAILRNRSNITDKYNIYSAEYHFISPRGPPASII